MIIVTRTHTHTHIHTHTYTHTPSGTGEPHAGPTGVRPQPSTHKQLGGKESGRVQKSFQYMSTLTRARTHARTDTPTQARSLAARTCTRRDDFSLSLPDMSLPFPHTCTRTLGRDIKRHFHQSPER